MEIFTSGVDILKEIINVIGGGLVISGLITFFLAQGESNAAQKNIGIGLFVAGAGIAVVANTLVPMLANTGL
ncbi:Maff2 family protein (plasmid) [Oscillospiraceae bacterium PP1C4]